MTRASGYHTIGGMPLELVGALGMIKRRGWISDESLKLAVRACSGRALPSELAEYICRRLASRGLKPRGPDPLNPRRLVQKWFAALLYEKVQAWILRRIKKYPRPARKQDTRLIWWHKAPSDIAYEIVRKRVMPNVTKRHIQNIASELNWAKTP